MEQEETESNFQLSAEDKPELRFSFSSGCMFDFTRALAGSLLYVFFNFNNWPLDLVSS